MFDTYIVNIPVAFACNLTCESCSHYSNHSHKGVVSLQDAEKWMRAWNGRIRPKIFSLLGGEPTIHPRLVDYVRLARDCWPHSDLRLVTNGFFLHRHPGLLDVFTGDPKASIHLSIHHESAEYEQKLQPAMRLLEAWSRQGVIVKYRRSFGNWTRRYHDYGDEMKPFQDDDPRQSWENCIAKDCKQIYQGKLWKCGPLSYLQVQKETHALSREWDSYLEYTPLDPHCSDIELAEFLSREEEPACGMCPAKRIPIKIPLPFPRRQSVV